MDELFIKERITQLRINKGVSEEQMSVDLGYDYNYIYDIIEMNSNLSISELIDICKYFEITLSDFFDESIKNPILIRKLLNQIRKMDADEIMLINKLINRFFNILIFCQLR